MKKVSMFSLVLIATMISCKQRKSMGSDITGKYWDLVYRSTNKGRNINIMNTNGFPSRTIFFQNDSVYFYTNISEIEIIDITKHSGDFIYSRKMKRSGDKLSFEGRNYNINFLSKDMLLITGVGKDTLIKKIYIAAKNQQKVKRL